MKKLYDEKLVYRYYPSPIGELLIAGNQEGLHLIGFPEGKGKVLPSDEWVKDLNCLPEVEAQLKEYFAGERKVFDLKLCPHGTEFQLQVLNALLQIPYGSTCSYVEIAQE
ncbi:MAG: MGMT family protein, partial [Pseudomonadales bacterium]|nr:MGMT family protein [Pseudomonadales bacterium]